MKRKLLLRVIIILMVMVPFVSSSAYSQSGEITHQLSGPGLWNADTILCGETVTIELILNNTTGNTILGQTNGFVLHTPDGATWIPSTAIWDPSTAVPYDSNRFVNTFSYDGAGRDTIGFSGFLIPPSPGIPAGFNGVYASIEITVPCSEDGKTICIDSSFFPPIGFWKWSTSGGDRFPTWNGPGCYTTYDCCTGIRGDVNGDGADANILDLNFNVNYVFRGSGDPGPCARESDVNGDGTPANILDLNFMVNRIFRGGPAPGPC